MNENLYMNIHKELSSLVARYFGSNANFYINQIADGSYRKMPGRMSAGLIYTAINQQKSIGSYQRNVEHTLNWICLDFDILKENIGTAREVISEKHLLAVTKALVQSLNLKEIGHFIEFSGNRGIHIWISFLETISPQSAFELIKYIVDNFLQNIDRSLIGLDLFPSSASHKSIYGKAVKIPLSKHVKSGRYSILLSQIPDSFNDVRIENLDAKIMAAQLTLLKSYIPETIPSIEQKLTHSFQSSNSTDFECWKTTTILLKVQNLSVEQIIQHWEAMPMTASLASDIRNGVLGHSQRQLLVGIFNSVINSLGASIGPGILDDLFRLLKNYNATRTSEALASLRHLKFPTQAVIESILGRAYGKAIRRVDLIKLLIPNVESVDDGLFSPHTVDLEVTKIAELNYIYQNDEVRCIKVIEDLTNINSSAFVDFGDVAFSDDLQWYEHLRVEKTKTRSLITLGARDRLLSTWSIKHLAHIYGHQTSSNAFGYRLNEHFSSGHIFKPWLYQWIQFLSNIANITTNEDNAAYFVVKADIKSFYDSIPHDNLERLLLTGINADVKLKLDLLQSMPKLRYTKTISELMRITRQCSKERKGVPQGPAYARYLAELYLGEIDEFMDRQLDHDKISFYHRYVDDIFFICETEELANAKLEALRQKLVHLGLQLNADKTGIYQVDKFKPEFDKYRSRAKYAVDAISKNLINSTQFEKEVALREFSKLASSQTEDSDAVFLFSHLPGLEYAENYRDDAVVPITLKGIGRGNLFRHVFNHLLQVPKIWSRFEEVKKLTALQSEVFTSVCFEVLSEAKVMDLDVIKFMELQLPKLTHTAVVQQNLIYLNVHFNLKISMMDADADTLLECIRNAEDASKLTIGGETLKVIESRLNGIENVGQFVSFLYPLCLLARPDKSTLNAFGTIFFAKLNIDHRNTVLTELSYSSQLSSSKLINQFYQLLCLFSTSNAVPNQMLLENSWSVLARLSNELDIASTEFNRAIWVKNFDLINSNRGHLNAVITSISEGAIWRGPDDKHKIYIRFHNTLMVFLLTGNREENLIDYSDQIETLKDKGVFYEWLFSKDTHLFPSRKWFLSNMELNDCILLKRDEAILIRKPISSFKSPGAELDDATPLIAGYADRTIAYVAKDHTSIFSLVNASPTFVGILNKILELMCKYAHDKKEFPNFFARDKFLLTVDEEFFSPELIGTTRLIFETEANEVENRSSTLQNFIQYLFSASKSDGPVAYSNATTKMTVWRFYQTYLTKMSLEKEVQPFLTRLATLVRASDLTLNEPMLDLAAASAAYGLNNYTAASPPFSRIKHFLDFYNSIHSSSSGKHIYKTLRDDEFHKETLKQFIGSICAPLSNANEHRIDVRIGLFDDIRLYFDDLRDLINFVYADATIQNFRNCTASASILDEKIIIDGTAYERHEVKVVNMSTKIIEEFSDEHRFFLNVTQDVFCLKHNSDIVLFFVPRELSISFSDIQSRRKAFFPSNSQPASAWCYVENSQPYLCDLTKASLVVSANRCISHAEAEGRLRIWLSHIPLNLREMLVTIIESHVFMSKEELDMFRMAFDKRRANKGSVFILKRQRDNGGIHRILGASPEVGRVLDSYGPNSIPNDLEISALFAELAISGSQLVDGFEYYLKHDQPKLNPIYYGDTESERILVGARLRNLKQIDLHIIFYTQQAINKLKTLFQKYGLETKINIAFGRDISDSALLENSCAYSVNKKLDLIKFLSDIAINDQLTNTIFSMNKHGRKNLDNKIKSIGGINLVTRYKSMPKGALNYLSLDFPNLPDSSIFVRVRETNEIPG